MTFDSGGLGAGVRGGYSHILGVCYFSYGVEDPVLDGIVELWFVGSLTKGYDKEFPSFELFPFANEIEVDVLEGGGGVCVMDLRHVRVGVVVEWVANGVAAGTVRIVRDPFYHRSYRGEGAVGAMVVGVHHVYITITIGGKG